MKLRKMACYDDFRCVAAACPDSCCKEWDVAVDADSAAIYQSLPGDLGRDIRQTMYREEGRWYFAITEGRCPMWRRDGLCRIQAELGHEALCQTCRDFPRLTHDYGDFVELGLELSCPEVARMLFAGADTAFTEAEVPGGEPPEYDAQDMALLLQTRQEMLSILEDPARPLPQALALALLYAYRAQGALDGGQLHPADPEAELSFGRQMAQPGDWQAVVDFYRQLEILTPAWRQRLENPQFPQEWDEKLRILASYGIQRYWLQAISDFDLIGRAKMVIFSCVLVHLLGGDTEQTAQLYAKEIENNWENVEALLEGAYAAPALTDANLLGLLLLC